MGNPIHGVLTFYLRHAAGVGGRGKALLGETKAIDGVLQRKHNNNTRLLKKQTKLFAALNDIC